MKTKFSLVSALMLMVCFAPLKNSGQDTLTIGEVYDYEVGDVFHISFQASAPGGGYGSVTNIEIIDKFYTPGNDTIFYIENIIFQESGTGIPFQIHQLIDTNYYNNLNITLPSIDSVYIDPNMYNGRVINYDFDTTPDYYTSSRYAQGCGMVYYYFNNWEGEEYVTRNLFYYNKSGEEWGNPLYVGIDEISDLGRNIKIFPNPATSFITINIKEGIPVEQVIIYNHLGQKVLEAKPVNNTIDVSKLKAGMYNIQISSGDWKKRAKMIKY